MQAVTLGELAAAITLVVGIISGVTVIISKLLKPADKWLQKGLEKGLEPINERFDKAAVRLENVEKDMENLRLSVCKNYIVRFLADVEQGEQTDEVERARFWENYDLYQEMGGNSYIKDKVDKLKKDGVL